MAGGSASGSGAGVGNFLVFADESDECLRGAGETAIAPVDEAKLAPKIDTLDVQELHFSRLDLILSKTLADK